MWGLGWWHGPAHRLELRFKRLELIGCEQRRRGRFLGDAVRILRNRRAELVGYLKAPHNFSGDGSTDQGSQDVEQCGQDAVIQTDVRDERGLDRCLSDRKSTRL